MQIWIVPITNYNFATNAIVKIVQGVKFPQIIIIVQHSTKNNVRYTNYV